jgi:hypothetical protein
MPTLRVSTAEEVQAATAPKQKNGPDRKAIEAVYDQLIADINAGGFATVTLEEGENKATTRNRLKAATQKRGLSIVFRRTRDETVVFHLEQPEEGKSS